MADRMSAEARSRVMRSVRSRDTGPELEVRRALHAAGLRFRLRSRLPGSPDLVLPRHRLAVFVHGCFWHRCPWCGKPIPGTNRAFWERKFTANVERDRKAEESLRALGWDVAVVWECRVADGVRGIICKVRGGEDAVALDEGAG